MRDSATHPPGRRRSLLPTLLAACLSAVSAPTISAQVDTPLAPAEAAATVATDAAAAITGRVVDDREGALAYASVVLYAAADSSVAKAEVTGDDGAFAIAEVPPGRYFLAATYVGLPDAHTPAFDLGPGETRALPDVAFAPAAAELAAATVTAQRRIVEVRPDRMVFNVEGTINAAGGDGLSLLRKAPGVVVDNNDDLVVMGRSGVLVYVDGKRSPLAGEALAAFLRGLPAEQIDRIDIITNPGAKYEAEGNAGIIDIRLKKNESWGSNGSVSTTASQGERFRANVSATVNHREGAFNTFATGGVYSRDGYSTNFFNRRQSGLAISDDLRDREYAQGGNLKVGTDYRFAERHTLGAQVSANLSDAPVTTTTRTTFAQATAPERIDSVLRSSAPLDNRQYNLAGNLNYRFDDAEGQTLSVDLDLGAFRRGADLELASTYLDPDDATVRSSRELAFDTPTDIEIYTATVDYGRGLLGGSLGAGAKYTRVVSENTFRQYEGLGEGRRLDGRRSNTFAYDEAVAAAYLSYRRAFGPEAPSGRGQTFSLSAGLRAEHTDARGELRVLDGSAATTPVDRDYLNLFPNAGLTWAAAPKHDLALSYGRRIQRPNYRNLNPFLSFASLVIFEQGNPVLRPMTTNSVQLTHTFAQRYTTKLSYSRTDDQIAQLTRKATFDDRAQYITWENLSAQTVVALTVSIPAQLTPWWETYFTATGTHTDNEAAFADGAAIDLARFSANAYNQHTFDVGGGWRAELSGWFAAPGIWGGTFETEALGAVGVGAQKRFFRNKLRLRVAVDDLFFTTGWRAFSDFGGTVFEGGGTYDSRRASVSLTYDFGNEKVRVRQRKTGLEDAAGRLGE